MSTSTGNQAEDVACMYITKLGFEVIARNWRTPVCEIDIVSKKSDTIYFVEVKYRSNPIQGTGLDYITPKKLKQMEYGAKIWVEENKWTGDYRLSAISVTQNFEIDDFIEDIE